MNGANATISRKKAMMAAPRMASGFRARRRRQRGALRATAAVASVSVKADPRVDERIHQVDDDVDDDERQCDDQDGALHDRESRARIDCTSSRPMPGQLNTVSVITAPA